MDLLSVKGKTLREYSDANNMINYVREPTIVQLNKINKSSSFFYVVLHNGTNIVKTAVIGFAFSDH